jgi:hypothetical protein
VGLATTKDSNWIIATATLQENRGQKNQPRKKRERNGQTPALILSIVESGTVLVGEKTL